MYGIPQVPPEFAASPLTEARFLLKAAAEIEHGLLVQYLYASFSITKLPVPQGWAQRIIGIAVQEMFHLINVQNLLLALKNDSFETYFDRANFPLPPEHVGFYPFAFRLEPFGGDSLSKYVSAESPLPEFVSDDGLRAELEAVIERAEQVTAMRTFGHVGNLYAYLYWLFLPSDNFVGPWTNFPADWFHC